LTATAVLTGKPGGNHKHDRSATDYLVEYNNQHWVLKAFIVKRQRSPLSLKLQFSEWPQGLSQTRPYVLYFEGAEYVASNRTESRTFILMARLDKARGNW